MNDATMGLHRKELIAGHGFLPEGSKAVLLRVTSDI